MKTHFFLPRKKEEDGTQVLFNESQIASEASIEDILFQTTINSMLMTKLIPETSFDKTIINGYSAHLVLNESTYHDERFDSLTIPDFPADEFSPAIRYEMYPEMFILYMKEEEIGKFNYTQAYFPLLEPLETGIVSTLLFGFLDRHNFKGWDSGKIIARVTDFRFEPEKEQFRLLSITNRIYGMFIESDTFSHRLTDRQKMEVEQKVLLLRHPVVCTDPSPDVGLSQSIMDNKRKLWAIERERTEKEFKASHKTQPVPKKIAEYKRVAASGRILSPKIPILSPIPQEENK